MSRNEVVADVAERAHVTQKEAARALEAVIDCLRENLAAGRCILLRGLGTLDTRHRKGRKATNPRTGEPVLVPPRRVATFKPGKDLKDALLPDRRVPRHDAKETGAAAHA